MDGDEKHVAFSCSLLFVSCFVVFIHDGLMLDAWLLQIIPALRLKLWRLSKDKSKMLNWHEITILISLLFCVSYNLVVVSVDAIVDCTNMFLDILK